MKRVYLLFILLCILSCGKAEVVSVPSYNQKANELIGQVISESPVKCNCISIPNKSMLKIIKDERLFDSVKIKKNLIEDLELKNHASIDSLNKLSNNFKLDKNLIKQKNLVLITQQMLDSVRKNKYTNFSKKCPNGILCIEKPIFDKKYENAILNVNLAFTCTSTLTTSYKYQNGKWVEK